LFMKKTKSQASMLLAEFDAVSDPADGRYGKHLSMEAIRDIVAAAPQALDAVVGFLASQGAENIQKSFYQDSVSFNIRAGSAAAMLSTTLHQFEHKTRSVAAIVRASSPYSLPAGIAQHVALIDGLNRFPSFAGPVISDDRAGSSEAVQWTPGGDSAAESSWPTDCGSYCSSDTILSGGKKVTPAVLSQRYNLGSAPTGSDLKGSMAVAEFTGVFWDQADLDEFKTACAISYNVSIDHMVGPANKPAKCSIPIIISPNMCKEALLDIQVMRGVGGAVPLTNIYNKDYSILDWAQQVLAMPNAPLVHSVSYENDESQQSGADYMEQVNSELQKFGARGLTVLFASGDQGAEGRSGSARRGYQAGFPSSSPFATSVGGTDFSTKDVIGDETCWVGSGGGFSNQFARPKYQADAVAAYLSNASDLPPQSAYNRTGRGIPDVAALAGNQNQYCISLHSKMSVAYGTSAATPVLAGVIAKLNELRLAKGKAAMGFINPFFYANPSAFNDVTTGKNSVEKTFTGGFPAVKGWDACTGLGTPDFAALAKLV
jgi:tripeptidyl-peptidase-1